MRLKASAHASSRCLRPGASVVFYERWRETAEQSLLDRIHDYNRTDCVSTQLLRDWLVAEVRPAATPRPRLGDVPEAGTLSNVDEEDAALEALRVRLAPVAEGLIDAQVDRHVRGWEKTSDHAPTWIELSDKPKRKRRA